MESKKCVLVGDRYVGKNKLAAIFLGITGIEEYLPTVIDNQCVSICVDDVMYYIGVFSTEGSEEYERLRPLPYPCVPIILVGSCAEVRKTPEKVNSLAEQGITLISQEQGEAMAKRIGAVEYIEWNDSGKEDVDFIFEEAIRACLKKSKENSKGNKKDKGCNLS
ncbi:Ras family, putative [Entamoeba histolytica]